MIYVLHVSNYNKITIYFLTFMKDIPTSHDKVNFRIVNILGSLKLLLCTVSSLIKIIPQTQFSYRRGLTGMAYRSSSRDLSIV